MARLTILGDPPSLARLAMRSMRAYLAEARRRKGLGTLDPRYAWYGLRGASRYVAAIARGDASAPALIDARLARCAQCPARTLSLDADGAMDAFCGPPMVDRSREAMPTCGCLLAGKAAVTSESCPRGHWADLTIDGTSTEGSNGRHQAHD